MANLTLDDLQQQLAIELDLSDVSPAVTTTDWKIRKTAINRALIDWAESNDWRALLKTHNGKVTVAGNATYPLPSNFRKIDGLPRITADGVNIIDFYVDTPSRDHRYGDSDNVVYIMGNDRDAKNMFIHTPSLVANATVSFTYFAAPTSLATTTDKTECPDPTFLLERALYYIYKGREDGRFLEAKFEADRILSRLIENEASLGIAELDRGARVGGEKFYGFRIGDS